MQDRDVLLHDAIDSAYENEAGLLETVDNSETGSLARAGAINVAIGDSQYIEQNEAKGQLHKWAFETKEEWETYNEQKEALPKAAFQFGVKMQDGRNTRKHSKD
ncbi:suppressor of mec-8 and unc-52 protein [Artemisia annua]|uniref:Suppressor of mec-8 and unc-52 protein n=1 Tax=Artemisia annua TaxID=35608 RepID=A0A2U1MMP2_ARTAN|nr:suppressor of mec-8 and unc-52 protein [Artemisia annua]